VDKNLISIFDEMVLGPNVQQMNVAETVYNSQDSIILSNLVYLYGDILPDVGMLWHQNDGTDVAQYIDKETEAIYNYNKFKVSAFVIDLANNKIPSPIDLRDTLLHVMKRPPYSIYDRYHKRGGTLVFRLNRNTRADIFYCLARCFMKFNVVLPESFAYLGITDSICVVCQDMNENDVVDAWILELVSGRLSVPDDFAKWLLVAVGESLVDILHSPNIGLLYARWGIALV